MCFVDLEMVTDRVPPQDYGGTVKVPGIWGTRGAVTNHLVPIITKVTPVSVYSTQSQTHYQWLFGLYQGYLQPCLRKFMNRMSSDRDEFPL